MTRFSRTVSSVSSVSCCGTTPIRARICRSVRPRVHAEDAQLAGASAATRSRSSASRSSCRRRSGPRKPNASPGATSKSMPSTAVNVPNRFVRPRARISGAAPSAGDVGIGGRMVPPRRGSTPGRRGAAAPPGSAEEALELRADDPVALARGALERAAVRHADVPAVVARSCRAAAGRRPRPSRSGGGRRAWSPGTPGSGGTRRCRRGPPS